MKKILLIEDEPVMRRNLLRMLEMEGFEAIGAADGEEGLAAALRDRPDLILCDISMPGLDGHGVLERLRAERTMETVPFIFLTARGERNDLRVGMNLGADDYLVKPVAADDLLAAIAARLSRAAAHERSMKPVFDSPAPLEKLGLTPREAEVLFWVAQGKSNGDIALILGAALNTIKKHMERVLEKLGAENRQAASLRAIEVLGGDASL